jgi:cyclophilin family peptidyl-prolyl cis-trans isomerase
MKALLPASLAAIASNTQFKKGHGDYFEGPNPDTKESIIIKIADLGEIEIGLFSKEAKKHVEEFKKNISSSLYKGMRVHEIKRPAKGQAEGSAPITVHLGHANSKDTDRTKWKEVIEAKPEDTLDFEQNSLSFFPGMVAAEQEKEGKSSARRFFMAVNDCAANYDGDYVIFGKVLRGMDILKEIADGDFLTEAEGDRGQGVPARDLLVESTELKAK